MIHDHTRKFFIEGNCNCAESTLLAASEALGFGLTQEDAKLVSAFGGGMGCGSTCGALAGAMAALGKCCVGQNAHSTKGFREQCAALKANFERRCGSTFCSDIRPQYAQNPDRCLAAVNAAADALEDVLRDWSRRPH